MENTDTVQTETIQSDETTSDTSSTTSTSSDDMPPISVKSLEDIPQTLEEEVEERKQQVILDKPRKRKAVTVEKVIDYSEDVIPEPSPPKRKTRSRVPPNPRTDDCMIC